MKIQLSTFLFAVLLGTILSFLYFNHKKKESHVVVENSIQDSLNHVIDSLNQAILIQNSSISKKDSVINYKTKLVKNHVKNTYNLHTDSSFKLFMYWTNQFRDSAYRERYFSIGADSIY